MQLNSADQINQIAERCNFSIFELPNSCDFAVFFPKSYHLKVPEGSNSLSVENIREINNITASKQSNHLFVVIEEAEKLTPAAAAAFLKSLEEPGENVHYVFLSHNCRNILPTIKSRAQNFYLPDDEKVNDPPKIDAELKELAKSYISAQPAKLPEIVEKILKLDKKNPREAALKVLSAAIHLAYKSYLITGNQAFLTKIDQLLQTQDAVSKNGHLKLQLIANML